MPLRKSWDNLIHLIVENTMRRKRNRVRMLARRFTRWWLFRWPIHVEEQAIFAEALSQALDAGLSDSEALHLAARIPVGVRFRAALKEMASIFRLGYDLDTSMAKSGARVADELRAAFRIGEERGCLSALLSQFAHQIDPYVSTSLAESLGRAPEVTRFAAALARLLVDRHLTVSLVRDAAQLSAPKRSEFGKAIEYVIEDINSGMSLDESLGKQSFFFDSFFCSLICSPQDRDKLRKVLARLGSGM
jgi:type II secretory pathway component PulF